MERVEVRFELDEGGVWTAQGTSPGHTAAITYGKPLHTARSRFVEALGALWDDVERSEAAQLAIEHVIPEEANTALKRAQRARADEKMPRRETLKCLGDAAHGLTGTGMELVDVSTLLGVTPASLRRLLSD